MCSRFELNATGREVALRFGLAVPPPLPNRAEICPTDQALVIGAGGGARLMRFGLCVEWDKRPLINARAETLTSKPTFRRMLGNRVLVPVTAWWEWQAEDGRKKKRKYRLAPSRPGPFALAGLAEGDAFVLVTCAPSPAIAHIHDRMPCLLVDGAEQSWLDPSFSFAQVAGLLGPCPDPIDAAPERDSP